MKQLVIGILAHVDAGKTTLSEALLYHFGSIRKLGRVDHGDTLLDSNSMERSRGITIFSKQAQLTIGDTALTLLDTPGHVDFSAETERTLQVLDYAVLVISGTDGVQSHTETLWQLLIRYNIPTFIFVNKMDLPGPGRGVILAELRRRFGDGCVDFAPGRELGDLNEELALCGEALMDEVLANGAPRTETIAKAVATRQVFPCFFGSALKLKNMDSFFAALDTLTLAPPRRAEFAAKVYKITEDEQGARLTHLKVTGGTLAVKASLAVHGAAGSDEAWDEKVNQLRLYSGPRFHTVDVAGPGTVCAVTGLEHTFPGQGLGSEPDSDIPVLEPVLNYRVLLPLGTDVHTALTRLRTLEQEDPQLHVRWNERLCEIHVQLMGAVQLEVLKALIAERFGMEVDFSQGSILYKETIAAPAEGVGHFEPLRHYAEVHLLLEPGARGSGLHFAADCREDLLDKNWQRLILTHLEEKNFPGVLTGAPITDMTITLTAGRAHLKHTEGGDFRQATYRAVRQGLRSTESILLEPWYDFRLEIPADTVGRAMSDLQRRGGEFAPPETLGDTVLLTGSAPVACLQNYPLEVTQYTRGKGRLTCTLKGYQPCHNAEEVIAASLYDVDADVDNTADSVFCSHGAGYVVKWNEVRSHMHIDTGWGKAAAENEEENACPAGRRAAVYGATLAEDKELMQIFERTYGPIKRDARQSFRPVRKAPPAPVGPSLPAAPAPTGPEYLLVDGYNIIFAWDDLHAMAQENLDLARRCLMDILCNYRGARKCELILVFDAYKIRGGKGEVEQYHNISVVYTKEAETADMYIEKVTRQIGREHRVRVATSDGLEQLIILGHGALRVSASAFRMEVDQVEKEIREYLTR